MPGNRDVGIQMEYYTGQVMEQNGTNSWWNGGKMVWGDGVGGARLPKNENY